MKRIFIQPVAMPVDTYLQWCDLANQMILLGYTTCQNVLDTGFPLQIYTTFEAGFEFLSISADYVTWTDKRTAQLDAYNPDLFLALAAMSEGPTIYTGEWVFFKSGMYPGKWDKHSPYKILRAEGDFVYLDDGRGNEGLAPERFRKATKDELLAHFMGITDVVFEEQATELPQPWEPKRGVLIRVRNHEAHGWKERRFLFKGNNGFCCVDEEEFNNYLAEDRFIVHSWRYAEPVPEITKVSQYDLVCAWAKANGKDPELVKVVP